MMTTQQASVQKNDPSLYLLPHCLYYFRNTNANETKQRNIIVVDGHARKFYLYKCNVRYSSIKPSIKTFNKFISLNLQLQSNFFDLWIKILFKLFMNNNKISSTNEERDYFALEPMFFHLDFGNLYLRNTFSIDETKHVASVKSVMKLNKV